MNVQLLVHGLPVGGTEVMVCHLARKLRELGNEVAVGCLDAVGDLGERLAGEGFAVEAYGRRPGFDARLIWKLRRSVRKGRFDVVHAHQYTPFFYAALAKTLTGVPLVFTEHGRFYPDLPSAKRRLFNRVFAGSANRITAVSRGVQESLVRVEGFAAERIEVVYNGIDLAKFAPRSAAGKTAARSMLGLPTQARVIGTVGRLDSIKNQPLLLHAFSLVLKRAPDAHLVIAGDGPEMEKLRTVAARLGLVDRAHFLGQRSDVDQIYAALDVFALSSFSEGTPMTIIEAMAASTPIVSTGVGGIPEIVADGEEALLVQGIPPAVEGESGPGAREYVERFAAALERVLLDPALAQKLASRGKARAHREFSLEAITARYHDIYRSAAGLPAAPVASQKGESVADVAGMAQRR